MKHAWRTAGDAKEDKHREQEAQLCYAKALFHDDLYQQ